MFNKRSKQSTPTASDDSSPENETSVEGRSQRWKWMWGWRPLAVAGGLFLVIQLVPYRVHDPAVVAEPNWDSPQTRALAVRACFDCHSNQTETPWYGYVAPMAWLVNNHVEDGRSSLNFSEWNSGQVRQAQKIDRVIRSGSMPPSSYTWFGLHSESKLTPSETDALIAGLQATIANSP